VLIDGVDGCGQKEVKGGKRRNIGGVVVVV